MMDRSPRGGPRGRRSGGSFPVPPGLTPTRAPAGPTGPEPYRILFPFGVAFALAGAAPWVAAALGWPQWPGPLHMTLMIEGFEQSFVVGFLLTAMPAFTRGERCRPRELAVAVGLFAAFAALACLGLAWPAHLAFAGTIVLVGWALASRVARSRQLPPEEFLFVPLGFLLGLGGVSVLVAHLALGIPPPTPRFGERLISLGMMLTIVLGVGGLLVPTFAGVRDPLVVPGVARPHERGGRRRLFVVVGVALVAAFGLEAWGRATAGALVRAAAASALLMLVWKLWRRPGQRGLLPWALWTAGWLVFAGLWLAALWPAQVTAAYHVIFLGGYGLLTLGIASRVTVAHGRHPAGDERRLVAPAVLAALALALLARLAAVLAPASAPRILAASALLWMLGWALWAARAVPRMARPRPGHGAAVAGRSMPPT